MKTGESLQDAQGTNWTIGQELGRGLWGGAGSSAIRMGTSVSSRSRGRRLPSDAPRPSGIRRTRLAEQRDLLQGGAISWLPHLEGTLPLPDGGEDSCSRYSSSLERRLTTGTGLGRVLELVSTVCRDLASTGAVHANLHPGNILISEDGQPLSPTCSRRQRRTAVPTSRYALGRASGGFEAGGVPTPERDTWALCQTLYVTADAAGRRNGTVVSRRDRRDRQDPAGLAPRRRSRTSARRAPIRFVGRVAEKLGSLEPAGPPTHEPSPPYRFRKTTDLQPRLEEVASLVAPRIESVGKVLLLELHERCVRGRRARRLSVSITCSSGALAHEDLVVGFVIDLDDPDQTRIVVDEARYEVKAPVRSHSLRLRPPEHRAGSLHHPRRLRRERLGPRARHERGSSRSDPSSYVPPPSDLLSESPHHADRPEPAEDAVAQATRRHRHLPGSPEPERSSDRCERPRILSDPSLTHVAGASARGAEALPGASDKPGADHESVPVLTPEPAAPAAPRLLAGRWPGTWEAEPSPELTYEETVGDSPFPETAERPPSWKPPAPTRRPVPRVPQEHRPRIHRHRLVIVAGLLYGLSVNICF